MPAPPSEPTVVWTIPLSYARELYRFVHMNIPGGWQGAHDELAEAIVACESGTINRQVNALRDRQVNPGYVEVRTAEQILGQARQCAIDLLDALDDENMYEASIHAQNATDSYTDLDMLLSTNKSAPLPADWQRQ